MIDRIDPRLRLLAMTAPDQPRTAGVGLTAVTYYTVTYYTVTYYTVTYYTDLHRPGPPGRPRPAPRLPR
jgi:hypothetical protein